MSWLRGLFGGKSQPKSTQMQDPGSGIPARVVKGMTKVTELEVQLGRYYQAHPTPDNQILVEVALNLGQNNSGLLYVSSLPDSEYGVAQAKELFNKLQGTGKIQGFEESLVPELKDSLRLLERGMSATERERMRRKHQDRLMTLLNAYVDVGRNFLNARGCKTEGSGNVF